MKVSRILILCGAVALPQLAMADVGNTSPQGLGIVHAILKYCAKVDARDAATFQAEWNHVVGGASEKQLDALESGGAYKQGYDMTLKLLDKTSKQEGAKACATGAVQVSGGANTGHKKDRDDDSSKKKGGDDQKNRR